MFEVGAAGVLHPDCTGCQRNSGPCDAVGIVERAAFILQVGRIVRVVSVNIAFYTQKLVRSLMDDDACVGVQAVPEKVVEADMDLAVSEAAEASSCRLGSPKMNIADPIAVRCLPHRSRCAIKNVAGTRVLVDQVHTRVEVKAERKHFLADPLEYPPSVVNKDCFRRKGLVDNIVFEQTAG